MGVQHAAGGVPLCATQAAEFSVDLEAAGGVPLRTTWAAEFSVRFGCTTRSRWSSPAYRLDRRVLGSLGFSESSRFGATEFWAALGFW